MSVYSRCHCPECKKWVPEESMNYFDGLRVCNWCLNQEQDTPPHDKFVYDPLFGKVQCVYCDSYDTYSLGKKKFKCRECEEEFII